MIKWRRRYAGSGLAGLEDAPRPGGPKTVLTGEVVCWVLAATLAPPPESLRAAGVTHWSGRRLADWLARARDISVSHDWITGLWRKFCLAPHRAEGFRFSTGPQLEAKVRDVVGLHLAPPDCAVVVCVDEEPQIRRQPTKAITASSPDRTDTPSAFTFRLRAGSDDPHESANSGA